MLTAFNHATVLLTFHPWVENSPVEFPPVSVLVSPRVAVVHLGHSTLGAMPQSYHHVRQGRAFRFRQLATQPRVSLQNHVTKMVSGKGLLVIAYSWRHNHGYAGEPRTTPSFMIDERERCLLAVLGLVSVLW
jgi:hypothetical protein